MHRLLVTTNFPSSSSLVTLMMETLSYSETSVLTRATRRNIPDDTILRLRERYSRKLDWSNLVLVITQMKEILSAETSESSYQNTDGSGLTSYWHDKGKSDGMCYFEGTWILPWHFSGTCCNALWVKWARLIRSVQDIRHYKYTDTYMGVMGWTISRNWKGKTYRDLYNCCCETGQETPM
jgi:hypothetical protein